MRFAGRSPLTLIQETSGVGLNSMREKTKSVDDTQAGGHLRLFRAEVMADSFTYSPSAMHSISNTCPLSTILELEGPDGMRKVGFLSSAGSSIVTHRTDSQRRKYYHLLCRHFTFPVLSSLLSLPSSMSLSCMS